MGSLTASPLGQIAEMGTPWELIQREDGILRDMCLKSGSFMELEATAKAKAEGADPAPVTTQA
jgi:hypothetical protein